MTDYETYKRIMTMQLQVDVLRGVLADYPTSTIESAIKQIQSRLDYYAPQREELEKKYKEHKRT
jgi:hypothetical protein